LPEKTLKGACRNVSSSVDRRAIEDAGRRGEIRVDTYLGILKGESGGGYCKLRESSHRSCPARGHERLLVEVANLAANVAGTGDVMYGGDVVDARFAGNEVLPESVLTDPVGGNDTQPGNDHTTWVLHLPVPLSGWNGEGGIKPINLAGNQSKPNHVLPMARVECDLYDGPAHAPPVPGRDPGGTSRHPGQGTGPGERSLRSGLSVRSISFI